MNDYLNHVGRPAPVVNRGGMEAPAQPSNSQKKKLKFKFNGFKVIFSVLFISITLLLIALVIYLVVYKDNNAISQQIKTAQFQAVFLNSSDGQVYFGHLKVLNSQYYELTDIYYIRVNSNSSSTTSSTTNSTANESVTLAKLGNEIHGPEDAMFINRDSVMFWENLKNSGQVVTAILKYQANGGQSSSSNATSNSLSNTTSSNNSTSNTTNP